MKISTVYRDFFTNTAVAWFTAGVISPLFNPLTTLKGVFVSFLSAIMTVVSLYLAKKFEKLI